MTQLPTATEGIQPGMGIQPPGTLVPPMMGGGMPMPPMMPPMIPGMQMPPMMMPPTQQKKGKGPQPINKWANVPKNNTIYVNNLNEKISRDELVNGLREVFGQYGKILNITCYTKIKRCKGQAWIVFNKIEDATKSIQELNNFLFFNKPLVCDTCLYICILI